MFSYLFEAGLKPEKLFLIGKSYSTDKKVAKLFLEKGSYVHEYEYKSNVAFDEIYAEVINDFIKSVKAQIKISPDAKIIVIDDGGFLINTLNSDRDFDPQKIVAVEQTTSGYDRIAEKQLQFPVINVARSWLKLEYESVFIAQAIVDQIRKVVKNKKLKTLIIGGGAIGNNIYALLKKDFEVSIFDIRPERSHFEDSLFHTSLNKYDLIIGCTGKTVLSQGDYDSLKKNVILVSASSSDREFDAVFIRRMSDERIDIHSNILVNNITLINSGFPINFVGYEIEKKENIQLTRALILTAIIQSLSLSNTIGVVDLDRAKQDQLAVEYKRLSLKEFATG